MSVRKSHALHRQFVDVWGRNLASFRVVTLHVAVAQVVGVKDQNIGLLRCGRKCLCPEKKADSEGDKGGLHVEREWLLDT